MRIIYPPTIDFEWMQQRPQQLMKEFAKLGHQVYYCQHKNQVKNIRPIEILPNLFLCYDPDLIPRPTDVLWIGNPAIHHRIKEWESKLVVYDCCDDFHQYWGKMEDELTANADIIVTTAQRIFERKIEEKGANKVFLIPNGVDLEHFKYGYAPKPKDLKKVEPPILGYVGALADWIDWDLVGEVANKMYYSYLPRWNMVLIGPEFHAVPQHIKRNPHITMLGLKDYKDLPAYISNLDVCMIPFKINTITRATNPIKLYEYLACGKPVVTTDMDEVRQFGEHISVCKENEDFAQKAVDMLAVNNPLKEQRRVEFITPQSWRFRAEKAIDVINHELEIIAQKTNNSFVKFVQLCTMLSFYCHINKN